MVYIPVTIFVFSLSGSKIILQISNYSGIEEDSFSSEPSKPVTASHHSLVWTSRVQLG